MPPEFPLTHLEYIGLLGAIGILAGIVLFMDERIAAGYMLINALYFQYLLSTYQTPGAELFVFWVLAVALSVVLDLVDEWR